MRRVAEREILGVVAVLVAALMGCSNSNGVGAAGGAGGTGTGLAGGGAQGGSTIDILSGSGGSGGVAGAGKVRARVASQAPASPVDPAPAGEPAWRAWGPSEARLEPAARPGAPATEGTPGGKPAPGHSGPPAARPVTVEAAASRPAVPPGNRAPVCLQHRRPGANATAPTPKARRDLGTVTRFGPAAGLRVHDGLRRRREFQRDLDRSY